MFKSAVAINSFSLMCLLSAASVTQASTLLDFAGTTYPSWATGSASLTLTGNTLTGTLTNTSPYDARVMGFGFDIGAGNINGFTGTANSGFLFSDLGFGNVPQFNGVAIDFGAAVNCTNIGNNNCTLNGGGSPNNGLDFGQIVTFSATGPFGSLTEAQIAAGLYVRFQRVGPNNKSDVARPSLIQTQTQTQPAPVPEPASMMLLGSGLLYLGRRRWRQRLPLGRDH